MTCPPLPVETGKVLRSELNPDEEGLWTGQPLCGVAHQSGDLGGGGQGGLIPRGLIPPSACHGLQKASENFSEAFAAPAAPGPLPPGSSAASGRESAGSGGPAAGPAYNQEPTRHGVVVGQ